MARRLFGVIAGICLALHGTAEEAPQAPAAPAAPPPDESPLPPPAPRAAALAGDWRGAGAEKSRLQLFADGSLKWLASPRDIASYFDGEWNAQGDTLSMKLWYATSLKRTFLGERHYRVAQPAPDSLELREPGGAVRRFARQGQVKQ